MNSNKLILKIIPSIIKSTFVFIFVATIVNANTNEELTLKRLCIESNDIIVGSVVSIESYWNASHSKILSKIEFEVKRKIKGLFENGNKVTMTYLGGSIDGITTMVIGAPIFEVGQESLLFLLEINSEEYGQNFGVLGLAQGKFNIIVDDRTSEMRNISTKNDRYFST